MHTLILSCIVNTYYFKVASSEKEVTDGFSMKKTFPLPTLTQFS